MLPTKPKSQLIVSPSEQPVASAAHKALNKEAMHQFARKVGNFVGKHPFWVLVVGSIGVHTAFVLLTPNPIKKTETPPEVIVPTIKLPPAQLSTPPKANKSIFDNLFVKSANNKLDLSTNSLPSSSSLLDRVDNFPLADNNTTFDDSLFLNSQPTTTPTEVDRTQTQAPPIKKTQPSPPSRFTESGQIDNTTPRKTTSSNIKPELQGNGVKNVPPNDPKNGKTAQNNQGAVTSKTGNDEKIIDFTSFMLTDPDILKFRQQGLLKETQIAAKDVLIPYPDERREKGVDWIPAKATNISGKSGTVTYAWLVAPDGKVEKKFVEFKNTVDQELVNIVRETVKDYKFKPIDNPQSGKYRLVSAKYVF
jgi:hypothetical protein